MFAYIVKFRHPQKEIICDRNLPPYPSFSLLLNTAPNPATQTRHQGRALANLLSRCKRRRGDNWTTTPTGISY